jgi:hypothetical protein
MLLGYSADLPMGINAVAQDQYYNPSHSIRYDTGILTEPGVRAQANFLIPKNHLFGYIFDGEPNEPVEVEAQPYGWNLEVTAMNSNHNVSRFKVTPGVGESPQKYVMETWIDFDYDWNGAIRKMGLDEPVERELQYLFMIRQPGDGGIIYNEIEVEDLELFEDILDPLSELLENYSNS